MNGISQPTAGLSQGLNIQQFPLMPCPVHAILTWGGGGQQQWESRHNGVILEMGLAYTHHLLSYGGIAKTKLQVPKLSAVNERPP